MNKYVMYKPKKDGTGMAANFQVSENGCFLSLAHQKPSSGDNDSFDWKDENGKAKTTVKLDLPDLGAFLALFNGSGDIKLYHEFEKAGAKIVTQINASPYSSPGKDAAAPRIPRGYSVNIVRGADKFGFGISFAEAEVLKVLFDVAIFNLTVDNYVKKA